MILCFVGSGLLLLGLICGIVISSAGAVVSGGVETLSNVVSRYLNQPIVASLDYHDPEVPPISTIKGVDLTTEGVITLAKVLAYAEAYTTKNLKPKTGKYHG